MDFGGVGQTDLGDDARDKYSEADDRHRRHDESGWNRPRWKDQPKAAEEVAEEEREHEQIAQDHGALGCGRRDQGRPPQLFLHSLRGLVGKSKTTA